MSDTNNTTDGLEDSAAPLIEHLAELRTRLIRSVVAFIVGVILCFAFAVPILEFMLAPIEATMRELGDPNPQMQYTAPQEYFFTLMRISMVFGFAVSFPVIGHQLWRFVAPGLYRNEQSAFLPFLIASPVLFILGASFAHFIVIPMAMAFFLGFSDTSALFAPFIPANPGDTPATAPPSEGVSIVFQGKVNETLDITLKMIVAFGLCFQLPVLLTLMGKAGLVSSKGLANVRKYAVVGILVLAALVTPPDVITQVVLFVVVFGLYELSIWLVKWVEIKREKSLKEQGLWDEDIHGEGGFEDEVGAEDDGKAADE